MECIYRNKSGFEIVWTRGRVPALADGLKEAVRRYGGGEGPDLAELGRIVGQVRRWMGAKPAAWDIGWPCDANESYFNALRGAVEDLAGALGTRDGDRADVSATLEAFLDRLDGAYEDYWSDRLSS